MMYSGVAASLLVIYVFVNQFPGTSAPKHYMAFALTFCTYEFVFLPIKREVFHARSRSYLQDAVAFIIPAFLLFYAWFGVPLRLAADAMGLVFPTMLTFARIGCFLGGCCYGLPSKLGVRYGSYVFRPCAPKCSAFGSSVLLRECLTYTPGKSVRVRVFPIQLVESAFHATILAVLGIRLLTKKSNPGDTLLWYFFAYAVFRFLADFARRDSARPRYGPLSEAQVVCAIVVVALGIAFQLRLLP
jgi:phosphatidylglycerol:prolipoprotein diacylglycerol transferase